MSFMLGLVVGGALGVFIMAACQLGAASDRREQ